ncbi:MAG: hypothetical protein ACXV4Z_04105 [Halobacteriota archaeon]
MMVLAVLAIDLIGVCFSLLELGAGLLYVVVGGVGLITAFFAPV